MGLFDRLATWLDEWHPSRGTIDVHEPTVINPATGLPTVAETGSVDVASNPLDTDLHCHHDHHRDGHDRWDTELPLNDGVHWHDPWSSGDVVGGHDPWRD